MLMHPLTISSYIAASRWASLSGLTLDACPPPFDPLLRRSRRF